MLHIVHPIERRHSRRAARSVAPPAALPPRGAVVGVHVLSARP